MELESLSVLEGTSGNERGGLIIRRNDQTEDDKMFKKPSMLGLDRLARAKRDENLRKRQLESGNETPGITESVRQQIKKLVLISHNNLYGRI